MSDLLGVVELFVAGKAVTLSKKLQLLVAALFGSPGRPVPAGRLIDLVWTEDELAKLKRDPRQALQDLVRNLREALDAIHPGARAVVPIQRNGTYVATVDTQQVDVYRFQSLLEEARKHDQQGDLQQAATRYGKALEQWPGDPVEPDEPLAGLYHHWANGVRPELQARHHTALLGLFGVELRLRQHASALPSMERLIKLYPCDEQVAELLMRALCLAGQQTRALEVYRELYARLRNENGYEPSDRLRKLYQQILNHDEGLQPPMDDQLTGIGGQPTSKPSSGSANEGGIEGSDPPEPVPDPSVQPHTRVDRKVTNKLRDVNIHFANFGFMDPPGDD